MKFVVVMLGLWLAMAQQAIVWAQPALDRVESQVRKQVQAQQSVAQGRGYLGIDGDDWGDQGGGVRVVRIVAGGPAAKAGLQVADVIFQMNGLPIRRMEDLEAAVGRFGPGTKVNVQFLRQGTRQAADLVMTAGAPSAVLGAKAGQPPQLAQREVLSPSGLKLGIQTLQVTEDARKQFRLPAAKGALVGAITVGSPASRVGIPLGAAITSLDGKPVTRPDDLGPILKGIEAGREVEIVYFSGPQEVRKRISWSAAPVKAPAPRELPAGAVAPAAAKAPAASGAAAAASRIEALERRVEELEERLDRIESASRSSSGR